MATAHDIEERESTWGVLDAGVVLVGTQFVSIVWAVLMIGILWQGEYPDPLTPAALVVLSVGLWGGYGLGSALTAQQRGNGPGVEYGALLRWRDVPPGLVLGVGTQFALIPLYDLIGRFYERDPGTTAEELIGAIDTPLDYLLIVFAVVVMAPLVEEVFFRGLLLQSLDRRWGAVVGVAVSSVLFAAVHLEWVLMPGLTLFGVISALAVLKTGRLGVSWIMHAAFNLTTVLLIAFDLT
ncbi:MAG: type II CAAX endopeptidase family protein [Actinomycetota bacterium]